MNIQSATRTTDTVVIGAGPAGLAATYEVTQADKRVILVDQKNVNNLSGQTFQSLGGILLTDSPEQRRLGVKDNRELAKADWFGSTQFDREEDNWGYKWTKTYLNFVTGERRDYLRNLGAKFPPIVGWAEYGEGRAGGRDSSVPRFHLTRGTGPEIVYAFVKPVAEAAKKGLVEYCHCHHIDEMIVEDGRVVGVRGKTLVPCEPLERGVASSRKETREGFEIHGSIVCITAGGIGGNLEAVRKYWLTECLGEMPKDMVCGIPEYVGGRGIEIAEQTGANLVNRDHMWHYTEGMKNWDPMWPNHSIRIIPRPSAMWFDIEGNRLSVPYIPDTDTVGTTRRTLVTGHFHFWFILNKSIVAKEFVFSGLEQSPDLTGEEVKRLIGKVTSGVVAPIQAFMDNGEDRVVADNLLTSVEGMNEIVEASSDGGSGATMPKVDPEELEEQIRQRDMQTGNPFSEDYQVNYVDMVRNFLGDKIICSMPPSSISDPKSGPPTVIHLRMLAHRTLGGIGTTLDGQCLHPDGTPSEGFYAAGEASGFDGGGVHGNNALEDTFLGGCIFNGRQVGHVMAEVVKQLPHAARFGVRVRYYSSPVENALSRSCREQVRKAS